MSVFFLAQGPAFQDEGSPPVGGDDLHLDLGIAGIAPVEIIDLAGEFPGPGILLGLPGKAGQDQRKNDDEQKDDFLDHGGLPDLNITLGSIY